MESAEAQFHLFFISTVIRHYILSRCFQNIDQYLRHKIYLKNLMNSVYRCKKKIWPEIRTEITKDVNWFRPFSESSKVK